MPFVLFKLKNVSMDWGDERRGCVFKWSVIVNLAWFDAGHALIVHVADIFVLLDRER